MMRKDEKLFISFDGIPQDIHSTVSSKTSKIDTQQGEMLSQKLSIL